MNQATRESFDRIFVDVRSKNDDTRQKAAQDLRENLESAQRERTQAPGEFQDIYRYVINRASQLATSAAPDPSDRIGGLHALTALISFRGDDAAQKTTRLANIFRTVMKGTDTTAMVVAARALGKLAVPGHPLTAELVDSEVQIALESLQVERQELRRFAAVLIIRELAQCSPTLLFQYVSPIVEVIWVALRDSKVLIREATAEAVSALYEIIAARELTQRDHWFAKIYSEISKGFQMNTVETIHGSLLALSELLLKGGMFMQRDRRYDESCNRVFLFKDHRDPLIRRQVIDTIPILAAYHPQEFSTHYLHKFMIHLQGQLKRGADRNLAFKSIGRIAEAVGSAIENYLDGTLVYIREGLSLKARNKTANDAPIFECISRIAIAVGQTLTKYMEALLDPIFACGLSDALIQALVDMAHFIPPAKQTVQEKLLNQLSQILSGKPFYPIGSPSHNVVSSVNRDTKDPQQNEQREAEITLALQTLGTFDFSGFILNEFVRDVVIHYVEDDNPAIRKAAALTCSQLFFKDPCVKQVSRHAIRVVSTVIERLLAVAVADPEHEIRHVVLISLKTSFDRHLAKAENVRSLFLALNDEVFANREAAMSIIGRLTSVNPAYVFPSLRKVLVQFLTEIEFSNSARNKQQSAKLISHLVNSSSRLIRPYVDPMVHVLLPKVSDPDESVAATTLATIGDLATVGGEDMSKYLPELMTLILDNLQDVTSTAKRSAALKAMGQLASNAGYVIQPFLDYPKLLTILMHIVKVETPGPLRRETIRLIGILGALDPYKHQQIVEQSPEHNLAVEAQAFTDVSLIIGGLKPSNEDYYPTVVIYTLTNLIKDPSLSQYHSNIIDAIMNIYATMGTRAVPYLDSVVPSFLTIIKQAPPARIEGYFNQLSKLIRIVRQHIRPHLNDILECIQTMWSKKKEGFPTMLALVESIARSLEGEFKIYLAQVLPMLLAVLEDDRTPNRQPSERVFRAFLVFGSSAEEYMHLIVPVIVKIFDNPRQPQHIRRQAIDTIGKLSRKVNISEFATRIIQPLCRTLASPDGVLKQAALDTLCALIFQLGPDYLPFIPTVNKILAANRFPHHNYSTIVGKLQKGEALPQNLSPEDVIPEEVEEVTKADTSQRALAVNQEHLKLAWDTNNRSTKEDWVEWIRRLSLELLRNSPHQALRACLSLASVHTATARSLFNSAFISCYTQLFNNFQRDLVNNIEAALTSPNIPPEILQQLLNLAEFMEHDDKALPIDVRKLGMCAGKCHAFAKALHYKELEFNADQNPNAIEALISINNQLQQSDAAYGILRKAQSYQETYIKETWFEKLDRWEDALASYQRREEEESNNLEVTIGKMRCLHALGEWDVLSSLAEDKWIRASSDGYQRKIAPLAAAAAWGLKEWELVDKYIGAMRPETPDRYFFGAILSIQRNQFDDAHVHIEKARDGLDTVLSAVLGES